jgi:hypothetical protein
MAEMTSESQPVACTLAEGDLRERRAWIAKLTREALRNYEREGLVLTLRYLRDAASRVREMVRKEQACCAFLTFETHEYPDELRVRIRAPENARSVVDAIFESFIVGACERAEHC